MMHPRLFITALAITMFPVTTACGLFDNAADCESVCKTYASCYDSEFNTDECRDNCIDESSGNQTYTNQVNSCEACIKDQDCVDNVFQCGDDCDGIID